MRRQSTPAPRVDCSTTPSTGPCASCRTSAVARSQRRDRPHAAARRAHAKRSCRTWTDADGVTGHLQMSGPVADIARVDNAIRHGAEKGSAPARSAGRREPSEAYAFDAAAELLTSAGDPTPTPAGADAKIIVHVDHAASSMAIPWRARSPRSPAWDRCPSPPSGSGWTTPSSPSCSPRARTFRRWCTWAAGSPPTSARRCSGRIRSVRERAAATGSAWSTTTSRLGRHPHQPGAGRQAVLPHVPRSEVRGWRVSDADADGQCTFTPPDRRAVAEAAADAVRAQRRRRAAGPAPPFPDTG